LDDKFAWIAPDWFPVKVFKRWREAISEEGTRQAMYVYL
jgi:hypothetical protein